MKMLVLISIIILSASVSFSEDIVTPSGGNKTVENILVSRAFWEIFDWNTVKTSLIYNYAEWSKRKNVEILGPDIFLSEFKGGVNFNGKNTPFSMAENTTKNSISFTLSVLDGEDKNSIFEFWHDLLNNKFGKHTIYYDGTEKNVQIYKKYQWETGNTLITLSRFDKPDKSFYTSVLSINYEDINHSIKIKPIVYIACKTDLKTKSSNNEFNLDIAIDEINGKVKDFDNNVTSFKLSSTDMNYRITTNIENNGTITFNINRFNGKISGKYESNDGHVVLIDGKCEKLNIDDLKM
jgi:hypothetical protein